MSNNHDSRMSIDAILNVIPDLQSFRPRLPPFETLGRPSCPGVERHNVLVQGITPAVDVDTDMEFYAETTLPRINITQFEDEEMDSDEELQMMMDAQVVDEEPEPTSSPQWVSVTKRTPLPSGRTMTTDDVAKAQKAKKKSFTCDVCTRIFCTKDGFRQHKQSKCATIKPFKCPESQCSYEACNEKTVRSHCVKTHGRSIPQHKVLLSPL